MQLCVSCGPAHKPMGMHVPSKVVDPRTGVDDAPIVHGTSSPNRVQIWTYGDHEKDTRNFHRLLVGLEAVKTPHFERRVAECVHRVLRMPSQTQHLAVELLAKVLRIGEGWHRERPGQMGGVGGHGQSECFREPREMKPNGNIGGGGVLSGCVLY